MPHAQIPAASHRERGIALVTAVLVLLLTSVLAGTFMATTTSERAIASNVHIARASLLSADAGVRVAQQQLATQAKARLDSLCALQSGNSIIIANPANFFPGGTLSFSGSNPPYTATASISFADSDLTDTAQVYNYVYTITATGTFGGFGQRQVQSSGVLRVSAERGSFADYLLFVNRYTRPDGTRLYMTSAVTYDGRMHSNDCFSFAYQPTYYDLVTQSNSQARFYNAGSPLMLNADRNGTTDQPRFFGGFTRGVPQIALPANAFNQQNAALGGDPSDMNAPANADIHNLLGATGNPANPPPDGVYVPRDNHGVAIGGIYIQGNVDELLAAADTANGRQVYRVRQGGTTTTVTIDRAANTTTIDDGSGTTTVAGALRGCLYVNGRVDDLRGPDRVSGSPPPAILDGHQMLLTASQNIKIQRDLTVQNPTTGTGVLGIFTPSANIYVGTGAPNNLNLDAFIMATGSSSIFEVENYGSCGVRGQLNMRGGVVTTYKGAYGTMNSGGTIVSGYAANAHFDRRGIVPPYFPTTGRYNANIPRARTLAWKEI